MKRASRLFLLAGTLWLAPSAKASDSALALGWLSSLVGFEVKGNDLSTVSLMGAEASAITHIWEKVWFNTAYRLVMGPEGLLLHGPAAHVGWVFWGDPGRIRTAPGVEWRNSHSLVARAALGASYDLIDVSSNVTAESRKKLSSSALALAAVLPELLVNVDYAISPSLGATFSLIVTPPLTNPAEEQTVSFTGTALGIRYFISN